MTKDSPDLNDAYALQTPDDSRRLYADWAETYDSGFVADQDYELHLHVARLFKEADGAGPILDVGAGTGICGVALSAQSLSPIDGTDISAEMLEVAQAKGVYRNTFVADVTQPLERLQIPYEGIVSSGTFTTGHVGPDAIEHLLDIAASNAVFALSINAQHYSSAGFEAKFDALSGAIADLRLPETRIYGEQASGAHSGDTALIAIFRKR